MFVAQILHLFIAKRPVSENPFALGKSVIILITKNIIHIFGPFSRAANDINPEDRDGLSLYRVDIIYIYIYVININIYIYINNICIYICIYTLIIITIIIIYIYTYIIYINTYISS